MRRRARAAPSPSTAIAAVNAVASGATRATRRLTRSASVGTDASSAIAADGDSAPEIVRSSSWRYKGLPALAACSAAAQLVVGCRNPLVHDARDRAGAQRRGRDRGHIRLDSELVEQGRRRARLRRPQRQDQQDRDIPDPASEVAQRSNRGFVDPVKIVDCDQQRRSGRERSLRASRSRASRRTPPPVWRVRGRPGQPARSPTRLPPRPPAALRAPRAWRRQATARTAGGSRQTRTRARARSRGRSGLAVPVRRLSARGSEQRALSGARRAFDHHDAAAPA